MSCFYCLDGQEQEFDFVMGLLSFLFSYFPNGELRLKGRELNWVSYKQGPSLAGIFLPLSWWSESGACSVQILKPSSACRLSWQCQCSPRVSWPFPLSWPETGMSSPPLLGELRAAQVPALAFPLPRADLASQESPSNKQLSISSSAE